MAEMGRVEFHSLRTAWKGEAADFTPLLAQQLDALGERIGLDLTRIGDTEVLTAGGRRIDIVAEGADGSEFVIENQFGKADHDHLTRGLAYAVARHARGLIVVAEEHRDEFRALAEYLNDLAEVDPERGISVWLVEAQAITIGGEHWAPLFTAVVAPNTFTATVEQKRQRERLETYDAFWHQFTDTDLRNAAEQVLRAWLDEGFRARLGSNYAVLMAPGPSVNGLRTVIDIYSDGHVMVPFHSYAGTNSGIPVAELLTEQFRKRADTLFGFTGAEKLASTGAGWLRTDRINTLLDFCRDVANAYARAQAGTDPDL
jgi:hypothetical protein